MGSKALRISMSVTCLAFVALLAAGRAHAQLFENLEAFGRRLDVGDPDVEDAETRGAGSTRNRTRSEEKNQRRGRGAGSAPNLTKRRINAEVGEAQRAAEKRKTEI